MASEWPVAMSEKEDSGTWLLIGLCRRGGCCALGCHASPGPNAWTLLARSHCGPLGRLLQARPPRPAPLIDRQPGKRPLLWNGHQAITLITA